METDWASLDCMVAGEAANGLEGLEACRKYNPGSDHLRYPDAEDGWNRDAKSPSGGGKPCLRHLC